ncbi:DUF5680 domain-containing protein [Kribbella sp. NPDC023855]|uniref:DUF5680 domain-containing protein n=1 Tax=Kribbella sp. NPDC023855 TaxID=3154698 RepID=UPI0033E9B09A
MITSEELEAFIVRAKAASYVGDGDLRFTDGDLEYRDSYFGGADFLGQEVVRLGSTPIWGMNYYGFLLEPGVLDAAGAGRIIKRALSALYAEGRFLGGFSYRHDGWVYVDESRGSVERFDGAERIETADRRAAYRLSYHGGRILG